MESSQLYFNYIAKDWDTYQGQMFSDNIKELSITESGIVKGQIAADLGAGTGFITRDLIKMGVKVIAIDQSEKMLDQLCETTEGNENLECVLSEAENLSLANDSVDFCFANMFLHHIHEPVLALKEAYRILRPGGKLILTDLEKHSHEFLVKEQFDVWMGFDLKQVEDWCREVGFINVDIQILGEKCSSTSSCGRDKANINVFRVKAEK